MELTSIDLFGLGAELDHVGMAVTRIDDVAPGGNRTLDTTQKVTVAFFDLHGLKIEIIEPAADDAPVSKQMQKGVKLLHLCDRVKDLEAAIHVACEAGLMPIASPVPAPVFGGR